MAPPDGYHSVNPYIVVNDAAKLVDFLQSAFAGVESERHTDDSGKIVHTEINMGDSVVMVTDGSDRYPPQSCSHYLYVDDVDKTHQAAVAAGATSLMEPADQSYGDRSSGVVDPTGNTWWIATRLSSG